MALALFVLVGAQCLFRSGALITNKPVDDRTRRLAAGTKNAAGCFPIGNHDKDGTSPVEELKRILEEGVKLLNGGAPSCRDNNKNVTWCKEPRADALLDDQDKEWYAELVDYLKKELAQIDNSLPIVAAVWDQPMKADAKSAQIMNVVCGFERLGMSKRFVLFATDPYAHTSFVRDFPNIISVYHPHIRRFAQAMATRTNVIFFNRVMKLAVAQMLLDTGRDVLITDTDIAWIRDSSEVLHKSGLDFAAMPDACGHDINSGFVYYRNVPQTKDLLHMALSTWRESWLCGDNDQYVLNCGWKRAAIKGLNYRVLPSNSWAVRCTGSISCRCTALQHQLGDEYGRQKFGIGDGYPYAYHTFGMTANYKNELDMLAALDMVDVDFKTGQCKTGPKNVTADTLTRQCSTREDGIIHAMCDDSCKKGPDRAEAIVADLATRLHSDALP
jgi:hypothetical protein